MKRSVIAILVLGLCSACHHRKPKKPKPKAHVEIENTCDSSAIVVFGSAPGAADAIEVELEPGETLGWTLRDREQAWSRDDPDAEWVAASDEGDDPMVVSICVSARFAQPQTDA
jgi:hypothetical protein